MKTKSDQRHQSDQMIPAASGQGGARQSLLHSDGGSVLEECLSTASGASPITHAFNDAPCSCRDNWRAERFWLPDAPGGAAWNLSGIANRGLRRARQRLCVTAGATHAASVPVRENRLVTAKRKLVKRNQGLVT